METFSLFSNRSAYNITFSPLFTLLSPPSLHPYSEDGEIQPSISGKLSISPDRPEEPLYDSISLPGALCRVDIAICIISYLTEAVHVISKKKYSIIVVPPVYSNTFIVGTISFGHKTLFCHFILQLHLIFKLFSIFTTSSSWSDSTEKYKSYPPEESRTILERWEQNPGTWWVFIVDESIRTLLRTVNDWGN